MSTINTELKRQIQLVLNSNRRFTEALELPEDQDLQVFIRNEARLHYGLSRDLWNLLK